MNNNDQAASGQALQKARDQVLFENWLQEMESNPHFIKHELAQNVDFSAYSRSFMKQLITTAATKEVANLSQDSLNPLFKLWELIKKTSVQQGLSSKDTAMLIFSLKATLSNMHSDELSLNDQSTLATILDFLGLLTFELYSTQQEHLLENKNDQIQYLQYQQTFDTLIGESEPMQVVYKAIGLVLENDMHVLLQGESGTGKDVIASVIHHYSHRKAGPFVSINCGAIPSDLLESELFGHEKGAFTGADQQRIGKFELANGGTLFLDEIAEMSMDLQVKLLRVLQHQEIERLGSNKPIKIDVRIISATHQNLEQALLEKRFREDLYYRISVFPVFVPPLRERGRDIILLAHHFLEKYAKTFKIKVPRLSQDANTYLLNYPWKGNVRELQNVMQRALVLAQGTLVTAEILAYKGSGTGLVDNLKQLSEGEGNVEIQTLASLEATAIQEALQKKHGNVKQTAEALGISRTTLYNKAKLYGIQLKT